MLLLYIGKSGAGKDTMTKRAVASGKKLFVSYTTRPMREGEVDGIDYHFVTKEEFLELYDKGVIVESRSYNTLVAGVEDTWYYGSPQLDCKEDYVGTATITSAMSLIDIYGRENVNVIYVFADDEIRKARAKKRGSFDETEWNRRLPADEIDFDIKKLKELEKKLEHELEKFCNNAAMEEYNDVKGNA